MHYSQELQEKNDQIFQIFSEMAEKNHDSQGLISTDQATVLVDEVNNIIEAECDQVKAYFSETNPDYESMYGQYPAYIDYNKFIDTVKMSLEEQERYQQQQNGDQFQQDGDGFDQQQQSMGDNQNNQNDQQFGNDQQQNQNQFNQQDNNVNNTSQNQQQPQDDMYQPTNKHYEDDPDSNIYNRHNNQILGNFINMFNKELLEYFTDFSKEEEGDPKVMGQDIPLIMRVGFYIDNITFHKTKQDPEEFFNKEESYKIVISQLDKYLSEQDNIDTTTIDIASHKIVFEQFLDFVEYFLQHEPGMFLRRSDNEDHEMDQDEAGDNQNEQTQLEKELRQNIEKYENLLEEAKTENERIVINNMLQALYNQLNKIESIKEPILEQKKKKTISKQENRKKNLNEIFMFYCKQQYTQAPKYSFDRLLYESHTMNMSNFLLFAKQFKVTNYSLKLTKKMLPQLFKKVSSNYKDLTFQEFQILLEKIGILMFEDKEDLPNEFDKIEAFYKYMGVDNVSQYRKQLHLLNPPFNIQDPVGFRHLPKDKDRNIEVKKIPPKLQMELDKRKKEREMLVQKFTSMTPQPPQNKQYYGSSVNNSQLINNASQKTPFQPKQPQGSIKYSQKNHQKQLNKLNLNNKVSWQQLERISYTDMKQIQSNSQFKPTDLFDDKVDNEDREYLKQYDLEEEKHKKQELSYIHRKEQESYGNVKNPLRPSQKYMLKHDPNYSEKGYQQSNIHRNHMDDTYNNPYQYQPPSNQQQYYNKTGNTSKNNISQNYMQRANQIDQYQRQKENQQIQSIDYSNNKLMQQGYAAAKR